MFEPGQLAIVRTGHLIRRTGSGEERWSWVQQLCLIIARDVSYRCVEDYNDVARFATVLIDDCLWDVPTTALLNPYGSVQMP